MKVNMANNNLIEHGPATAEQLITAPNLHIVDMSGNHLGEHGPATAEQLATSDSIRVVNMANNELCSGQAIAIAKSFAYKDNPIKLSIDIEFHHPISEAIKQDNDQMHAFFEQAISDTFGHTPPGLLGLMEGYADFLIELE